MRFKYEAVSIMPAVFCLLGYITRSRRSFSTSEMATIMDQSLQNTISMNHETLIHVTEPGKSCAGVLVDAVAPTVVGSPTGPIAGSYSDTANSNLDITVVMSEAVTVDDTVGTPTIPLTIGGQVRNADYFSGTGTTTLVFRYTIASDTDVYANGTFTVGDINTAGGTIQDAEGTDADLTGYSAPTPSGVLINRAGPTITVTDGDTETSVAGDIIEFTATYLHDVIVIGTPQIAINVGGSTQQAIFTSGSSGAALVFQYVI
jgi:hypothetical protein